jgi:hypothetical protein
VNKTFLIGLDRLCLIVLLVAAAGCAPVGATLTPTSPPTITTSPTVAPTDTAVASNPINPEVNNCNITPPPPEPDTPLEPGVISRDLPCAFTFAPPATLDNLQLGFDFYSWLTFNALNSPLDSTALIGQGEGAGGDAQAVWEDWKEHYEFMLPNGQTPAPWGTPRLIPSACEKVATDSASELGKNPHVLSVTVQPFDTGPLIDQAGDYALYEIMVNQPMFEFIVQNQLYNQEGQAKLPGDVIFPEGRVITGTTGLIGALMVKASWKVMGPQDDPSQFHTRTALVHTPPSENPKIEETCVKKTVGLVGMHLVHKTQTEPQWIWSTFEHARNAPTQAEVNQNQLLAEYNFYKPDCPVTTCPINQPPPRPWNPNVIPFPQGFTSQVIRLIELTSEVHALNKSFQSLLKGTVWENYILISTQWPTDGASKIDPTGAPAPVFLANTTLETYSQGEVPQSSSSCMDCHGNAVDTQGHASDFTFILQRAEKAGP